MYPHVLVARLIPYGMKRLQLSVFWFDDFSMIMASVSCFMRMRWIHNYWHWIGGIYQC